MSQSSIRNVALIGPHGAGKTSLVEAALYDLGAIPQRGSVERGTSVTDTDAEATARQMSVSLAVASARSDGLMIHFLDTPGLSDFATETDLALTMADAAVLVLNAAKGVDAVAQKLYRRARSLGRPVMVFINGLDRDGARDYASLVTEIKDKLDSHAVALDLPLPGGAKLWGETDVVTHRTFHVEAGLDRAEEVHDALPEHQALIQRYHTEAVEAIAEQHDDLLNRYLDGQEPSVQELMSALKADVLAGKLLPILCGSALANLGIDLLVDAIVHLLPAPGEVPVLGWMDGKLESDPAGPLAMVVGKTLHDPYLGKVSVVRVLSGTLLPDAALRIAERDEEERAGRLFKLVGKKTVSVEKLEAGDIGALMKLKHAQTGDTMLGEGAEGKLKVPLPTAGLWSIAIAPKSKADEAKLATALAKLKEEDPGLSVGLETRTHRTLLTAQGPTHLEVALARLEERHHVAVTRSEPEVPYRETIRGKARAQGKHKKQTGGHGQYGDVWLQIEPRPRGAGFEFVDAVVGGAVPRQFIPAVEKGVKETLQQGLLAGYPIVDVKVTLDEGSSHSVDSSEAAFKTAAHLAMKQIFAAAQPVLLEPLMHVHVRVPDGGVGEVSRALTNRRGQILALDEASLDARLPMAELAGFVADLQRLTRGEGGLEAELVGYEEVPTDIQAKVLATVQAPATV